MKPEESNQKHFQFQKHLSCITNLESGGLSSSYMYSHLFMNLSTHRILFWTYWQALEPLTTS